MNNWTTLKTGATKVNKIKNFQLIGIIGKPKENGTIKMKLWNKNSIVNISRIHANQLNLAHVVRLILTLQAAL